MEFHARSQERSRVARDLHDTLLQTIHGSRMIAEASSHQEDSHVLRSDMARLAEWLARAAQEGRIALAALRESDFQERDLGKDLRHEAERSAETTGMTIECRTLGKPRHLSKLALDEMYWIAREAVRNACKHANATRLSITIKQGAVLTIEISDNGQGMPPRVMHEGVPGHFGIRGMRERAARIGATFQLRSSPESGTQVVVSTRRSWWKA